MTYDKTELRAFRESIFHGINIYIRSGEGADTKYVTDMVLTSVKPGDYKAPACVIDIQEAQVLMDDLWAAGIRPTEGQGSAGQLAATEAHLKDMRRLVFDHVVGVNNMAKPELSYEEKRKMVEANR